MYLMDIIGKQIDNPLVELYQKRFPYYKMDATEDRKSIKFTHPEGMVFTVEELIAMILKQAQDIAEKHAGIFVSSVCVPLKVLFVLILNVSTIAAESNNYFLKGTAQFFLAYF